uniref:Uncharacterized protein n=1 Tax=Anopheles quadriannulatus TaxID=34691 RepID=A0A182XBT9_ANOQN
MAEVPSSKMEESFWRGVVLRWVERSGLNPGQDYIDLAACYESFRSKLKGAYELQEATVAEFMRAKFPRFELRLGPGGEIPESEYVYVFSLMLYFSCIKHPVPYFQNIGKEFDEPFQYSMKAFLHSFVSEGSKEMRIDRAFLERAFGNAARSAPACRADAGSSATLCQSAVQMITSTPNGKREMKKPSPVTPKSVALEWKVKNLSELLVTARAENTSQERQIEQLLQSVQELQEEKRRNLSKISALELKEACVCMSDAVDYLAHPLGRATEQLQKQLESKNRSIEALEEELSRAKETASTEMERYRAMKKQYATLEEDNQLMKLTAEALREELAAKDGANQNLAEAVNDLRRFIRENHLTNGQPIEPLESSFEFLDRSFKNVTPGNDSLCNDAETLAATVVDVKLKEKEHENECLNRKVQELEQRWEEQCKAHAQELARMQTEAQRLAQTLEACEQAKAQLEEHLERERATTNELNAWKVQLNQQLADAKVLMDKKVAEQQESLGRALEQAKAELVDQLLKYQTIMKELDNEKKQLVKQREEIKASMSAENAELRRSLEAIEQNKTQLAASLKMERALVEDLTRRNQEMEAQKIQLNEEFETSKASTDAKIAALLQSLDANEQTKAQLANNLEREMAKTRNLTSRNTELDVVKKQLTQELELVKTSMHESNAELQRSLEALGHTKTQLADNLEQEMAKTADLNRRTEELEAEKKQLMQELEVAKTSMNENIAKLQRSLEAIEQTKLQLADNLEKEIAKTADLNRRTEELEVEKKQLKQELDDMKATNAALRQSVEVLEQTKTQITNSLELELVKIGDLQHQLNAMGEAKALAEKLGDSERSEMLAKISLLQQNLEEEREKSEEINCQYLAMKRQADDLDAQCTKLMKSLSENRTEVSDLQQQLAGKTAELEQLKLQYETKQSQKAKEEDLDRLALENEKISLQQEVTRLQAAMDEKTDTLRRSLESVQEAKSQLAHDLEKERQRAVGQQAETADKLAVLQQQLDEERQKCEELNRQYLAAKRQAEELTAKCTEQAQKLSDDCGQLPSLQQEIVSKQEQLETLKAQFDKVLAENEKYVTDCEILSVKLYCARKKHTEMEAEWAQERAALKKELHEKLHESRIEHQNTMEKMKNHMVKLHEESKTKLEHDKQGLAATAEGYRRKIENLETRCTMLQKQLAEMNERNLETRKENQLLQLRLKTIEEHQGSDRKSLMLPSQSSLRSNLQMEDEVGELFDNMYLTELKNGRCTPPDAMHADFDRYSELSRRNSRQPPHLRTNYMALAPDCIPPQDDTGDNISTTFDDSSTGLISRRKVSGITSYKRPGPPTPSKRAGRLSLNGPLMPGPAEVQYRDALRDTNANGAAAQDASAARTGRTKTPGKFKQMMSASSLLSNFQPRDENTSPRRRLSWFNKGKKY